MEVQKQECWDGPACPHCGAVNEVWVFRFVCFGEWAEHKCAGCGRNFDWQRVKIRTWEVRKK